MKNPLFSRMLLVASVIFSFSIAEAAGPYHSWEVISISFKSSGAYQNPYAEIPATSGKDLLKVTFNGTSGKTITIVGFWNGGQEWKVNFAAPFAGRWNYVSSSSDRSMDGKKGNFEVIKWSEDEKKSNPTRHGFVRVKKDGPLPGHFFEYSDGQPFLWIGDTWWNWTNNRIQPETFRQMVDDRSGFGSAELAFGSVRILDFGLRIGCTEPTLARI
jgi:hypothetical protein